MKNLCAKKKAAKKSERTTYVVRLEDSDDGFLGDELGELDVTIFTLLVVVLIFVVVLIIRVLLELRVLDGDDSTGVSSDLRSELKRELGRTETKLS